MNSIITTDENSASLPFLDVSSTRVDDFLGSQNDLSTRPSNMQVRSVVQQKSKEDQLFALRSRIREEILSLSYHVNRLAIILGYSGANALLDVALCQPSSSLLSSLRNLLERLAHDKNDVDAVVSHIAALYVVTHASAVKTNSNGSFAEKETDNDFFFMLAAAREEVPASTPLPGPTKAGFADSRRQAASVYRNLKEKIPRKMFGARNGATETAAVERVEQIHMWVTSLHGILAAEAGVGVEVTVRLLERLRNLHPVAELARKILAKTGSSESKG